MLIPGTPIWIDNGVPSEIIWVIAATHPIFRHWCRTQDINPNCPMVKHVYLAEQLQGQRDVWYTDLGLDFSTPTRSELSQRFHEQFKHVALQWGFNKIP